MNETAEILEQRRLKLEAIGSFFAKQRDYAVTKRKESGIEKQWQEDTDYYEGVDELNLTNGTYTKLPGGGGMVGDHPQKTGHRATAFFNLTRQFVDSATARITDIICPDTEDNYRLRATPIPDLVELKQDNTPIVDPNNNPVMQATGQQATVSDIAENEVKIAEKSVKKAGRYISDWLTECSFRRENRRAIADCLRLGTGVLEGPIAKTVIKRKILRNNGKVEVVIEEKTVPVSNRVSCWDCFPDPDCGENIQDGSFFFLRKKMTERQLIELKKQPRYLADQIDKVIEEGPNKWKVDAGRNRKEKESDSKLFDVWFGYADMDLSEVEFFYEMTESSMPDMKEKKIIPVIATLINDTVVKVNCSPIESGEYPFDFITWQQIESSPWGIGLARQGRTAQEFYCSMARNLTDNANLSGRPMVVVNSAVVEPADGEWDIYGGKVWNTTDESAEIDVTRAFMFVAIPMFQQELQANIVLAKQMMEESTGIFFLMQGDQGGAPDTVGGMQLLHNNSSAVLREFARNYDDKITVPHIDRYYHDWLLTDPEIPDDCKIELTIEAIGSAVLVERSIQETYTLQLAQLALQPAYGWSPKKAGNQVLKALRFDPDAFEMDEEEQKQIQPGEAPQVTVAKIHEQGAMAREQIRAQVSAEKTKVDTDRDTAYNQSLAARDQIQAESKQAELEMKYKIALLEYAKDNKITLDKAKVELAKTSMELNVTRELAHQRATEKELPMQPPIEPAGKAPAGESFQK